MWFLEHLNIHFERSRVDRPQKDWLRKIYLFFNQLKSELKKKNKTSTGDKENFFWIDLDDWNSIIIEYLIQRTDS